MGIIELEDELRKREEKLKVRNRLAKRIVIASSEQEEHSSKLEFEGIQNSHKRRENNGAEFDSVKEINLESRFGEGDAVVEKQEGEVAEPVIECDVLGQNHDAVDEGA